jgi:hypothetical protein
MYSLADGIGHATLVRNTVTNSSSHPFRLLACLHSPIAISIVPINTGVGGKYDSVVDAYSIVDRRQKMDATE